MNFHSPVALKNTRETKHPIFFSSLHTKINEYSTLNKHPSAPLQAALRCGCAGGPYLSSPPRPSPELHLACSSGPRCVCVWGGGRWRAAQKRKGTEQNTPSHVLCLLAPPTPYHPVLHPHAPQGPVLIPDRRPHTTSSAPSLTSLSPTSLYHHCSECTCTLPHSLIKPSLTAHSSGQSALSYLHSS